MSSVKSVGRGLLHGLRKLAGRPIAAGLFVAVLSIFAFADLASSEITANLQAVSGASGVYADPVSYSIADINSSGGILIGDELFDSFTVTSSSSPSLVPPVPSGIEITPVEINDSLGFKVNSLWLASGGQWEDSTIQYRVGLTAQAAAQGSVIDGNALYTTGVGSGSTSGGVASIAENLFAQYPALGVPFFATESNYYISPTNMCTQGSATFAPVTSLWVVEGVGVSGGSGPGAVQLGEFYQTFQSPEPSTFALLGIGAIGLFGYARRRGRAS